MPVVNRHESSLSVRAGWCVLIRFHLNSGCIEGMITPGTVHELWTVFVISPGLLMVQGQRRGAMRVHLPWTVLSLLQYIPPLWRCGHVRFSRGGSRAGSMSRRIVKTRWCEGTGKVEGA